jgi:hypothetical protein
MHYDALMRDARNESLTASTRVRAAFDALYECCLQAVDIELLPAASTEKLAETVLAHALISIPLSPEAAALVHKLSDWALKRAPFPPLPMTANEAVALAVNVYDAVQETKKS